LLAASIVGLCLLASPTPGIGDELAAGDPAPALEELYRAHRWFELRDAVAEGRAGILPGAVAAAFDDSRQAEGALQEVIEAAPDSQEASEARGLLIYLYQRSGRYRKALAQVEALLAASADASGAENARALFAAFARHPDQSVSARHRSELRYEIRGGNLFVPLSIHGKPASYILDTGADFSALSESEAKRLGLTVEEVAAQVNDSTGGAVELRVAVAGDVAVGRVQVRNLAFLVFRDDQQPFVDLPSGERGIIGMPVLLGLQTVRWGADGTLEVAFRTARKRLPEANLCFDGATLGVEAGYGERKLDLVLDTGSTSTDLWPAFAKEFAGIVESTGKRDTRKVTGVGSSVDVEAVTLPEATIRIGGLDTVLRPAHVLLSSVGSERYHGRLGFDLLQQARRVTLDFKSMRLALEQSEEAR
jgi:predicted aspartyl protease